MVSIFGLLCLKTEVWLFALCIEVAGLFWRALGSPSWGTVPLSFLSSTLLPPRSRHPWESHEWCFSFSIEHLSKKRKKQLIFFHLPLKVKRLETKISGSYIQHLKSSILLPKDYFQQKVLLIFQLGSSLLKVNFKILFPFLKALTRYPLSSKWRSDTKTQLRSLLLIQTHALVFTPQPHNWPCFLFWALAGAANTKHTDSESWKLFWDTMS